MSDRTLRWVVKPLVFAACLLPVAYMIWAAHHDFFTDAAAKLLTADPLKEITHETGDWTIRFIVITLAITPLRRVSGWNRLIKFRRMAGLFAFFYGTLHFLIYIVADRFAGLDFPDGFVAWSTATALAASIWDDIAKRPYITVGFLGWSAMVPLAVTSTAGWIRRLGGRSWNKLHRLIYLTAVAGVVHYWWLVKADIRHPAMYASIVVLLLGARAIWSLQKARPHRQPARVGA